jgi:hypothetical protein
MESRNTKAPKEVVWSKRRPRMIKHVIHHGDDIGHRLPLEATTRSGAPPVLDEPHHGPATFGSDPWETKPKASEEEEPVLKGFPSSPPEPFPQGVSAADLEHKSGNSPFGSEDSWGFLD